ncbi:hypothetical protein SAMN02910400_00611 [Lachnospiraceae bacterium C10]|nr:hypothetical protein SAMN02910400_00611 [Lachnospiraceae bacterium C10]
MPKNPVKTIPVNKDFFMKVLNVKGMSIRKLGAATDLDVTDKTIRRQLNSARMREKTVNKIAKYINVDPYVLTGRRSEENEYYNPLLHLERHPYFEKERRDYIKQGINENIKNNLHLFDISFEQYEALSFDEQCRFQEKMFQGICTAIQDFFSEDAYGNKEMPGCERLFYELDSYIEDHNMTEYAETTLRKRFEADPPIGYTKKMIEKMTPDELLDLDRCLQWSRMDNPPDHDIFADEYGDNRND